MNPIEELKTEHRAIEAALDTFANLAERWAASPDAATAEDAGHMLAFFRIFTDTCHHGKEEEHLFPALERVGVPREGGPIGVLLAEHEQGRARIRTLQAALDDHGAGKAGAAGRFRAEALGYRDFLRQHIRKEDDILFRIASERLPADRQADLADAFERLENEKIGPGKHEQLHGMLADFEKKYGSGESSAG